MLNPDGSPAAPGTAILARIHPANDVKLTVKNHRVRVRVRGPRVQNLSVETWIDERWRRVKLNQRGRGKVPGRGSLSRVRISADVQPGFEQASTEVPIAR